MFFGGAAKPTTQHQYTPISDDEVPLRGAEDFSNSEAQANKRHSVANKDIELKTGLSESHIELEELGDLTLDEQKIGLLEGERIVSEVSFESSEEALGTDDPFPEDPDAPEEQQFTVRAVFVGCSLGAIISASNVYLGLKTGWTFGAGLFGSIFGFAILKSISKTFPERWGGGHFGPKENMCCTSAATAAGSLGLLFCSGFPAAYQLGLLGESPSADFGRLIAFTLCCAYVGIFFTMPLRRLYILKLKLTFPGAVAVAVTIRSLHVGSNAEASARKKTMGLVGAFLVAITWRVVSEYAPGIMWDLHWSWWLYKVGWKSIIAAESWGWIFELTPAFIGIGLLVPLNASASFASGTTIAWMFIGPILVATGRAIGTPRSLDYPGYMNYADMVLSDPINAPSPKYWFIWPGCMCLLCASMAEIAANYKSITASFGVMFAPFVARFRQNTHVVEEKWEDADPVPLEEQTPRWMWMGGLALGTIMTMIVMKYQFGQSAGMTFLAVVFSFFFSLISAECVGRVSVNPVTTLGNFSQLIFGGISKGQGQPVKANQLSNGLTGMITLAAAEQCADMLGDLKATHLLGASPRVQLYAQCWGALVSIVLSPAMYVVFSKAYPCINDLSATSCSFPAPDVGAWRAVSIAVSSPSLPIPRSSAIFSICLGLLVILQTYVKHRFMPPEKHHWLLNWNAVGIAFILGPTSTTPFAMFFGSIIAMIWRRKSPGSFTMYGYAVAAGGIAGEGLGGIVNALLQISGVAGSVYGTAVGCPMAVYCG